MNTISFFFRFALTSYAAVVFFVIGLGISLSKNTLNLIKLLLIFSVMSVTLCFSYTREPFPLRLTVCGIWTSVLWFGFRFGHKITSRVP